MQLYQFVISHFCEKARWALDHKQLSYRPINLIPGPHMRTIKKMAQLSSVPVLKTESDVVQGSSAIIDYLESRFQARPLTPAEPEAKREAAELERVLDSELGEPLRAILYEILLAHRGTVIPLWSQDGPIYGALLLQLIYPLVRRKVTAAYIQSGNRQERMDRFARILDRTDAIYAKQPFLVGEVFSRADLTLASLLAPLCQPPEHLLRWSSDLPPEVASFQSQHRDRPSYRRTLALYQTHRWSTAAARLTHR